MHAPIDLEEQFITVLKKMQLPVALLKPKTDNDEIVDFIYVFINKYAAKSYSKAAEEIVEKELTTVFPSVLTNGFLAGMKNVFRTGIPEDIVFENYNGKTDNNSIKGRFKIHLVKYNGYIVINWFDYSFIKSQAKSITDLKASNEDLEQFAYVASHDLQEPLRMVTSFTQLLQKRYSDKLDDDANEFIRYAVDGAVRMKELIDNLLIYSKVATQEKEWVNVNIQNLIEDIEKDYEHLLQESNSTIKYNNLPEVYSEESMLNRLFTNLISNAIKYRGDKNPVITISAHQKSSEWIFSVEDNGIGIEEKYFAKIFLIFKRLHSKSEYPGTGIGLAICKKIVDKLGGRIWVDSRPGVGSTFYFTIPI